MTLSTDNLELACQVVEKTASEKAIREVDDRLQVAYQVRIDKLSFSCPTLMDQLSNVSRSIVFLHVKLDAAGLSIKLKLWR